MKTLKYREQKLKQHKYFYIKRTCKKPNTPGLSKLSLKYNKGFRTFVPEKKISFSILVHLEISRKNDEIIEFLK